MESYEEQLEKMIKHYSQDEIVQICKSLNQSYNIYDSERHRWEQLQYILSKTDAEDIRSLQKVQLSNKVINDLIMRFYPCERVVKYHLIKHLMPLSNHIVAFEMCVGNSRIDVCRINGKSYAYEIKTAFDTFERLKTQMNDYMQTFEKVYLVVPKNKETEALLNIPEKCGLITYRSSNGKFVFSYRRKAQINICDITKAIYSLSSADLMALLQRLEMKVPACKQERISSALTIDASRFWTAYKAVLKEKYQMKWTFLRDHFDDILPIDIQNFFATSIDPSLTYEKKGAEQV